MINQQEKLQRFKAFFPPLSSTPPSQMHKPMSIMGGK
jgi:hypothetical protein